VENQKPFPKAVSIKFEWNANHGADNKKDLRPDLKSGISFFYQYLSKSQEIFLNQRELSIKANCYFIARY
jgi:hypothetical protein